MNAKVSVCVILGVLLGGLLSITAQENTNLPECDPQINCRMVLFSLYKNGDREQIADLTSNVCRCASDKRCVLELRKDDKDIYYCR